jgi:hypothetical protein
MRLILKIMALSFLTIFVLFVIFIFLTADTRGKRQRSAARTQVLLSRIKSNPNDTEAMKELLGQVNGTYKFGASYALGSIGSLGPAARPALPVVLEQLKSSRPIMRREAANSLSELGPNAISCLDEIESLVATDPSRADYVGFCIDALGKMGEPAVRTLPILRRRLNEHYDLTKIGDQSMKYELESAISNLERFEHREAE